MDPDQALDDFLEEHDSPEEFWSRLKTNLQAGKLRLVFVADEIPAELKRVVEFLNEQMDPAEVLAVEIRQYVGEGLRNLIPTVFGLTARAQMKRPAASGQQWTEEKFFEALDSAMGSEQSRIARRILEWSLERTSRVWWGRGATMGSFVPVFNWKGRDYQLFATWTYGTVEVYFQWLKKKPPFDQETKRLELLEKLNRIGGVALDRGVISKRPGIPLAALVPDEGLPCMIEAFNWVLEEIKAT